MKKNRMTGITFKLLVITGLMLLAGCENKESIDTRKDLDTANRIKTSVFKGMFNKDSMYLIECSAKKKYRVAPEGDLLTLEKVYELKPDLKTSGEYYIETVGFSSVKENASGGSFDTMLVITGFIGLDSTFNCLLN